jgi:hypothetical protein
VCKFGCDQLPSQRGTKNRLANHCRDCLHNENRISNALPVGKWRCKHECDRLPLTPGNKRALEYHYKKKYPLNKKRTENTIDESDKNGQDGEKDIAMEPNEADANVMMA